ncbi:S41 family peptidase [Candidatus Peregrinibacteria bacterium]|jgi:carboxyl-terminal processing protease|nr:S41 family peptidase [Candidatus Peregrinibacteria bacterium]
MNAKTHNKSFKINVLGIITAILVIVGISLPIANNTAQALADHRYEAYVTDLKIDEVIQEEELNLHDEITQEQFLRYILRNSEDFDRDLQFDEPKLRFSNVPNIMPYAPYIYTALNADLIEMPENRTFMPKQKVNKVHGLKMIFDLYGIAAPRLSTLDREYKDIPAEAWYIPMIVRALELKLVEVESLDFFGVKNNLTIGETAQILGEINRVLSNQSQPTEVYVGLPDIEKIEILYDVYSKINEYYYYENEIDETALTYGAISGLVNNLEDRYSTFNTPTETNDFIESNTGEYQGVGMWIEREGKYISVAGVVPNSPAEQAGLKVGDVILKINGIDIEGWSLQKAASTVRGPVDTKVTLYVQKHPGNTKKNVTLERKKVEVKFATGEVLDHHYAYFDISQFPQDLEKDFTGVAKKIINNRTKGIILDLRNNPGGYVNAAEDLLKFFLKKGEKMYFLDYRGNSHITRTYKNGPYSDYKIVVLIDASSASASEIVAAALKDNDRATIIGEKSFGKGVAQQLFFYDDGSSLKLTIAEWLSPNGHRLNKEGITPDIKVTDNESTPSDEVIKRALRYLKNGR